MKNLKIPCFSSFFLKIVAIISMTFDHVGVVMNNFWPENSTLMAISGIFRIIGRLALPLFCFMIVEGVIHTKSFKKYISSLGIIGVCVLIAQIFMYHVLKMRMYSGNIFIDLILGACCVKLLMGKNNYLKLICLLPIAFGIISHLFYGFEWASYPIAKYFPEYLRAQYGFYGIALIIGFYFSRYLAKIYYKVLEGYGGLSYESVEGTPQHRMVINMFCVVVLVVFTLLYYMISFFTPMKMIYWDPSLQNNALFAGALILLYNGKRGYNSLAFKYGCYLYYPLHLLIAYGIGLLIFNL